MTTSKTGTDQPDRREAGFVPFSDAASVRTIGTLSFENGTGAIAVHGSLDVTRDEAGLSHARALKRIVDAIVAALEGGELPEAVAEADMAPAPVTNPFA